MAAKKLKSLSRMPRIIYLKLVRMNDSPLRISLGFAIGIFTGIMPGTGPIAALVLAFIFRVNRAASLLGSILTNTWLSIATFLLAIKTGAAITKIRQEDAFIAWAGFLSDFRLIKLFKLSVLKIVFPVITGYIVVGACAGFLTYASSLLILNFARKKRSLRLNVKNIKNR